MAVDNRNFVNTFANEGGADVLVEDKRMDELKSATAKTGSQISTSAQYIPLQDTDGNLVKINPASFEEAVRNVLGTLLANNDKGTTISGIPALSGSGANLDFGSVTPANLASVLGVINGDYVGDFNDAPINVTKLVAANSPANAPISGQLRGFLTTKSNSGRISQTYTEVNATDYINATFQRAYKGSAWSNWSRVDNFGCATAADLASLLGANYVNTTTINDADLAPLGMSYLVVKSGVEAHAPINHVLIQTSALPQSRKFQVAYPTFKDNGRQGIYYRVSNDNGTFTDVDWVRMYDPSILSDSTILAPLASALGVIQPRGVLSQSANNIFYNSAYVVYGDATLNTPSAYGILITIVVNPAKYGYWCVQLFIRNTDKFYMDYRIAVNGQNTYGSWLSIQGS